MASGNVSITIKLFSALREALGESEFELALSDVSEASAQVDVAALRTNYVDTSLAGASQSLAAGLATPR